MVSGEGHRIPIRRLSPFIKPLELITQLKLILNDTWIFAG